MPSPNLSHWERNLSVSGNLSIKRKAAVALHLPTTEAGLSRTAWRGSHCGGGVHRGPFSSRWHQRPKQLEANQLVAAVSSFFWSLSNCCALASQCATGVPRYFPAIIFTSDQLFGLTWIMSPYQRSSIELHARKHDGIRTRTICRSTTELSSSEERESNPLPTGTVNAKMISSILPRIAWQHYRAIPKPLVRSYPMDH